MNLISAENLSFTAGEKVLFSSLNFGISKGERVGLIGVNGTGKSTLLSILAGRIQADSGKVSTRKEIKVGYLSQNPSLNEDLDVFDNVFNNSHKLTALIRAYEKHIELPADDAVYLAELDRLNHEMQIQDAWSYESRVREIIGRLGIGPFLHQPVGTLSGGQRKRVALAKILAEEPDVLILDEPTNHLDIDTVEWLQNLITTQFDTLLVVTHDRYFLDAVSNQIVELDRGKVQRFQGNYAYYLEKKQEQQESEISEWERNKNLYRKELDWIRRMPKARGTKSKSRISAFDDLKEKVSGPAKEQQVQLDIRDRRQGGKILEVRGIAKTIGDKALIRHFRHYFQPGEKAGIIGPNGCGKTTLLRLLNGEIPPDKGDIVKGENTVIGYYSQEEDLPEFEENKRLIDVVNEIAPNIELSDRSIISASQFLTRFKFPPEDQYKLVSKLSGGERKRLQLLRILIQNPNFLILDEPTNDLDIGTLNVLEEFLESFKGSVLIVSHDRYFMDRLTDHLFVFEGDGEIRDFPGNYTDYREWKNQQKKTAPAKPVVELKAQKPQSETVKPKTKRSFKEQRELELAEKRMEELDILKAQLHQRLTETNDHEALLKISEEIQQTENEHDNLMLRWMELSEI